ncbi:MAG: Fe-S cluster assembly ATPase SufC [Candidatus Gracilibacteria bacterium]|nr:Fe-S cluster assembly ATPase SufC [Candidatus Gracilibacteria bacterium]
MNRKAITVQNLKVGVGDKEILKGVSLNFCLGKNYCLLGKNGSGKSTLSAFLMGHPKYEYISGEVNIDGKDLLSLPPEERSQAGLFLSFQNVPEIKGIKLSEYLRTIYNIHLLSKRPVSKEETCLKGGLSPFVFKRFIKKYLEELHIEESFLNRELNVGFSGGEKRKIEMLQMKLIGPKYIILDEIDSGLDLDAFKKVAELLKSINNENNSLIIITHYFKILNYVDVDEVYVIKQGLVDKKGGKELIDNIKKKGYE